MKSQTSTAFREKDVFGRGRNALVAAYVDDSLNDEEFLIVYDYYEPVNPLYP